MILALRLGFKLNNKASWGWAGPSSSLVPFRVAGEVKDENIDAVHHHSGWVGGSLVKIKAKPALNKERTEVKAQLVNSLIVWCNIFSNCK